MSKQDRQGVRTPADIERKYNFAKMVGKPGPKGDPGATFTPSVS